MPSNISLYIGRAGGILGLSLLFLIIYYLINIGNNYVSDGKEIEIRKEQVIPVVIGLILIVFFITMFKKYSIVSDTIYTIIFSAILAYLFNPLINYFEGRGLKRVTGVLILYLTILAVIFILAFLVIPRTSREIKKLIQSMPSYINGLTGIVDSIYNKYYVKLGELPPIFQGIQAAIMENIDGLQSMVIGGIKSFISGIINTFSKVVSIVLTPILTLYFLVDKDYFKKKITNLIPERHKPDAFSLFNEIDNSLSLFVRGRLIMAAYVGICTTILLFAMNIEFALVIGVITGFADIIPYIGPFLGFLPAVFFAFLSSPMKALWVAIIFLIIQWTENNVLAPKVIGDSTGIHPMVILLSIIIGGGIFGVLGMILSVPFVAVVIILYNFIKDKIKDTRTERSVEP